MAAGAWGGTAEMFGDLASENMQNGSMISTGESIHLHGMVEIGG